MKAAVIALALVSSCFLSVHAVSHRQLLQAPVEAPSSSCPTVFEVAQANGLTTLVEALTLDELEGSLDDSTGYPLTYTVFAPTNEAFESLLAEQGVTLEDLRNSGELDDILQYHFIISPYTESQLESLGTVQTNYRNTTLSVGGDGTVTAYNSTATIIMSDVQACESIIQVIDGVLVPDFELAGTPTTASS